MHKRVSCELLQLTCQWPPKASILLGWVTILALDYRCTLPPMVHPIIVGYLGEPDVFNQPCGNNLGVWPWGRLGAGRLVHACSRCHL